MSRQNAFNTTSGYGYNDLGRDTLEKVYASCFGGEAALVRPQITCGTHALALALMSNLRPGDELLIPGRQAIRYAGGGHRHPAVQGIARRVRRYLPSGGSACRTAEFDYEGIRAAINERTHLVTIQRSKGYAPAQDALCGAHRKADRIHQGRQAGRDLHGRQLLRRIRGRA